MPKILFGLIIIVTQFEQYQSKLATMPKIKHSNQPEIIYGPIKNDKGIPLWSVL